MLKADDNFDGAVNALSEIAKTDGDTCVCEGRLLLSSEAYKSPNAPRNLQELANTMVTLKHNVNYKHFFQLVLYLLTLPVTAASYERAHSKVSLVKSAVRASMNADRLEDLVLI